MENLQIIQQQYCAIVIYTLSLKLSHLPHNSNIIKSLPISTIIFTTGKFIAANFWKWKIGIHKRRRDRGAEGVESGEGVSPSPAG